MGTSTSFAIEGQGNVVLKMTLRKLLTLNNVLYMPEIRKNLISGSLMNKHGFKTVFESDKIIFSKCRIHLDKGYLCNGFFKPNVLTMINEVGSSVYLLESSNIWHVRLEHVNHDSMQKSIDMERILTL